MLIVTESDLFSTRILHSMETAQVGRSIAQVLGLNERLAEAICLGHDVGHTPFGHIGEDTIKRLLDGVEVWDSNAHSLKVLESLEKQYPEFDGLDLTWATREGIARHKTVFDIPSSEHGDQSPYGKYKASSPECQVADKADEIAYLTHDVHDALQYRIVSTEELDALGISLWDTNWRMANGEMLKAHPDGWTGVEREAVLIRRVHGLMIARMVNDVVTQSLANGTGVADLASARGMVEPVISFSEQVEEEKSLLVRFLYDRVYKSPLVARQNAKAARIIRAVFDELVSDTRLLPFYVQERIKNGSGSSDDLKREVALFIASLTDRGAIDLYNELFSPADRAMGHHVQ